MTVTASASATPQPAPAPVSNMATPTYGQYMSTYHLPPLCPVPCQIFAPKVLPLPRLPIAAPPLGPCSDASRRRAKPATKDHEDVVRGLCEVAKKMLVEWARAMPIPNHPSRQSLATPLRSPQPQRNSG